MKVLNANVLLKVIIEDNVHSGTGLSMGDETTKNEKFLKGEVIDFGELVPKIDDEPILKIGDKILFDNNRASNLTLDGELHKLLLYGDAVIIF